MKVKNVTYEELEGLRSAHVFTDIAEYCKPENVLTGEVGAIDGTRYVLVR